MLALFREQPRAFRMIFMLEIWERFGFYTVQGILTLYFIRFLGFNETQAYYTFGAYSALVYGLIVVGGYLGDKILGTRRTIVIGLITLAAGYLALALANKNQVFWALGLICTGNGLFKANPSSLLAKCYNDNDPRLHGGFTLYYMAINMGSTVALLVGPAISSHFGYFYAYFLAFIGILLAITNYWFQRKHVLSIKTPCDVKKISMGLWSLTLILITSITTLSAFLLQHVVIAKSLLLAITTCVIGLYIYYMRKETKPVILRMIVAFILMLEAVVFFTLYQQMPTSLTLFAVNNVHPYLLGIAIDPQSMQALNPIWIITMSPVLAWFYKKANQRDINFSIPYKFTAGMFSCALSFSLLYFSRFFHDDMGMVSSGWLVASYFFQSTGELLVSALGVAMVAELVPKHIAGFVMGMWFLTTAVAGFTGAWVGSLTALPTNIQGGMESLMVYTKVFAIIGLITLSIAILMLLLVQPLNRFSSAENQV